MTEQTERDWVAEVGAPAYTSIVEMVAALECDYDRLTELRDERDSYKPDAPDVAPTWAEENPDDAAELAELEEAAGECDDEDESRERIQEDALSVQVRSGWEGVGKTLTASEYELLLTTGGPAVRIVGELDDYNEPSSARLQVQNWGKPWTEYFPAEQETLLTYARCFNYGE